jgi:hypothetical protein
MTRVLRKPVACPHCGRVQTVPVMYSWNELLSGPYSEDRFRITCADCAQLFVPHPSDVQRAVQTERRGLARWLLRRTQ